MNRHCSILFVLLINLFMIHSNAADHTNNDRRTLESYVNPNCELQECSNFNNATSDLSIVYVRSSKFKTGNQIKTGKDLHFILSTYGGNPAFLVVSTDNNVNLSIDWTKLFKNEVDSIKFKDSNGKSIYNNTIGIMVSKLFFWLDNETEETGYTPDKSIHTFLDPNSFVWKNVSILSQTKDNVHVNFELKNRDYLNGTINFRLMISSITQKYVDLPSLLLTSNSVHAQLTLDGFADLFPENSTKRLGMELTMISKGEKEAKKPSNSWDDEWSPGIFSSIKYPFGEKNSDASFLYFKPNAYLSKERLIAKTIDTTQPDLVEQKSDEDFKYNNAFYGFYAGKTELKVYNMTITFGSKKQASYSKTNTTEFSFVAGLGDLPEPELSLFIKLVIIIGSGLSLLVLFIFPVSIFLMARKMKRRKETALLNNQDSIY